MAMKSTTTSLFKDVCLDAVGGKPLRVLYHLIPNGEVHLCSTVKWESLIRAKFGNFGELSMICQTKTIEISTYN